MKPLTVSVDIDAPKPVVWSLITDIENSGNSIGAIEEIEVLERPAHGLRGLKWRETRRMYGKKATETMWITDVADGSGYTTEARSHGSIYRSDIRVSDTGGGTRLSLEFSAEPTSVMARLVSLVFGGLIARSIRGAVHQDLLDLKAAAESRARAGAGPSP